MSTSEGDLGIRSIKDTMEGLQGKLAWSIMKGESIWSRLLLQKYGREMVQGSGDHHPISSQLWKQLEPHFQRLRDNSRWILGKGNEIGQLIGLGKSLILHLAIKSQFERL